ncbi:ribonuclease H-like domain-containing protein [Tanacetum coccineum]
MQKCNPCNTLVDTESKLGLDGDPVSDPPLYRNLAGALNAFCTMYAVLLIMVFRFTCYCVFLGDNLLSWSTKRQVILSRSGAEAEYHSVANMVFETA